MANGNGTWLRRLLVVYLILFTLFGAVAAAQMVTGAQASLTSENEVIDQATGAEGTDSDQSSSEDDTDTSVATANISFLFVDFTVSGLVLVLAYIGALGLIGGAMQGVRAVAEHRIGDRSQRAKDKWKSSYAVWYVVLPLLGALNALILYLVFAAGFVGSVGNTSSLNFYGVSAIAIFGGLFSQKTFRKFAQIFDVAVGDDPESGQSTGAEEDQS